MKEYVAIVGASDKPERYAHKAMKLLQQTGHHPLLVSPKYDLIDSLKVYSNLDEINNPIDTVTMYISQGLQSEVLQESIIRAKPKRVIFNPGTENYLFEQRLGSLGITPQRACTLVLLRTGEY